MYIRTSSFVLLPSEFPQNIHSGGPIIYHGVRIAAVFLQFQEDRLFRVHSSIQGFQHLHSRNSNSTGIQAVHSNSSGRITILPEFQAVPQHFSVLCSVSRNLRNLFKGRKERHSRQSPVHFYRQNSNSKRQGRPGRFPVQSPGSPCSLQGPRAHLQPAETAF